MSETSPERALLIWNPVAGRNPNQRVRRIQELAAGLRHGGWKVDTTTTDIARGAASAAERGIHAGYTILLACGGDGTLHEVANALMRTPSPAPPALALAPLGTANVFAHAIGCPTRPRATVPWLLRARRHAVRLGRARRSTGTDFFVCLASAGFDAHVVHQVPASTKRRWGKLAYAGVALAQLNRYSGGPIHFTAAGGNGFRPALGVIYSLTRFYAGKMRLGRLAPDEAIVLALRGGPAALTAQALSLALATLDRAPGVERVAGSRLEIATPGIPLELDGEAAGHTPVAFDLAPQPIQMLLHAPPEL